MPPDATSCPGCGASMQVPSGRGIRHECPKCGGRLIGLSPFEQMLSDGLGAHIWVASSDGDPGVRCPFCTRAMGQPAPDTGAPSGLAVCHTCQQVWIPASAASWLSANAAPSTGGSAALAQPAAEPPECANCGAPFQPDDMGRCQYCHAQIAAPRPIVFEVDPSPRPPAGGLLGALANALTDVN
jgi:DNA-directed RNA polymerase subunit RPC12/RpoP